MILIENIHKSYATHPNYVESQRTNLCPLIKGTPASISLIKKQDLQKFSIHKPLTFRKSF